MFRFKKISVLAATAFSVMLSSCGMSPSNGTARTAAKNECKTGATTKKTASLFLADDITYEKDIKSIVNAKCAWCHSSTAKANVRETPYLTTFAQVKSKYSDSMQEINSGKMPPKNVTPQLDPGDKALMVAWSAGNFIEGEPLPPVDTSKGVFYEDAIKPLLAAQCTGCHMTGGQSPALDTYATAKSGAPSSWIDIEKNSMPKAGPLSTVDRTMFKTWIDDGMPFNAANDQPAADPVSDSTEAAASQQDETTPTETGSTAGTSTKTTSGCQEP